MVAGRILEPGSKLSLEHWVSKKAYIDDLKEVDVHNLYRAMDVSANLKMFFTCFGKMFFMWYGMICPQKGNTSGATAPLSGDTTGGAHANGEGSGSLVG